MVLLETIGRAKRKTLILQWFPCYHHYDIEYTLCSSRKYPYPPPHGGSRKFRGVGGLTEVNFQRGGGLLKEFSFQWV